MDVFETGDTCLVVAEIAGVARDAVQVELCGDGRTLTLAGTRTCHVPPAPPAPPAPITPSEAPVLAQPAAPDGGAWCGGAIRCHQLEITTGRFERRVLLPCAVDADAADATCQDGLLAVRLPKAPPRGRVRVEVRVRDRAPQASGRGAGQTATAIRSPTRTPTRTPPRTMIPTTTNHSTERSLAR